MGRKEEIERVQLRGCGLQASLTIRERKFFQQERTDRERKLGKQGRKKK